MKQTPEKSSEIQVQLLGLDTATDGLFDAVNAIQERLQSVLKPTEETESVEKGPSKLTPLASKLQAVTDRILAEKMRLIDMTQRIEL